MWGITYDTYLDPLVKLQKRAIRLIASAPWRAHTEPLFVQYKLLTLEKLYVYSVQLFMFKYQYNKLPGIFSDFYVRSEDVSNRSTRHCNSFRLPERQLDVKSRSIWCAGVTIYNHLYNELNMDVSILTYKKYLKAYLIDHDVSLLITKITKPYLFAWNYTNSRVVHLHRT